jgi:hypothetical protein
MEFSRRKDLVYDVTASVNVLPGAQALRHPERSSLGKDALLPDPKHSETVRHERYDAHPEEHTLLSRPKAGAPIAQVLNNETPTLHPAQPSVTGFTPSAPPFSGRLADLLLDPSEQQSKQVDQDQRSPQTEPAGSNNSVIKLPKPPQLPTKTAKRPRIPPLLQGLHQPPPLPTGRLFPPITSDQNTFPGKSGARRAFDIQLERPLGERDGARVSGVAATYLVEQSHSARATHVDQAPNTISPSEGEDVINGTDHSTKTGTAHQELGNNKPSRKRKRWSNQETKDLLMGVSRFGIGNWKKILHCPDLSFDGRTAVDLKDRFRVCCPGEGLKQRKPKGKGVAAAEKSLLPPSPSRISEPMGGQSFVGTVQVVPRVSKEQGRPDTKSTVSELAEMGIRGPFAKSTRRPRCEFTEEDDVNLLNGFKKYGPVWHLMRDDTELGFGARHPTDLRDRFRIRYPSKYAQAGYKLKRKRGHLADNESTMVIERGLPGQLPSTHNDNHSTPGSHKATSIPDGVRPSSVLKAPRQPTYTSSGPRFQEAMPYLSHPLPNLLDEVDAVFDHDLGDESPITLNRDILQWADASASSATLAPLPANTQTADFATGDTAWNLFAPNDLFPTLYNDTSPTSKDRYRRSSDRVNQMTTTTTTLTPTKPSTTNSNTPATANLHPQNPRITIPQTPNLPNIVYPHVPAASARNTVHNLPAPADLLLGVEMDKPISQALGTGLEDTFGFMTGS